MFVLALPVAKSQQGDCAIVLKNAQKTYDAGAIEKVPDMLQPCLESGFTREERIQAYRLLILTYLFGNNKTDADKYMVKLLKTEPEYQVNPAVDPPEFIKLYESYRTLPLYSVGVIAGGNFSFVNVLEAYSLDNVNSAPGKYKSKANFQGGINVNRYLYDHIELSLDIIYMLNTFEYVNNALLSNTNTVTFLENQTWIRAPLTATYAFDYGKWKPFARLGGCFGYLLNDQATVIRNYGSNLSSEEKGPPVNMFQYNQREKYNYWIVFGGGVRYMVKRGFFTFDLGYNLGLANIVNQQNRFSNTDLLYTYYYVDSDFKLSNLTFSLGFNYSFYKPTKKKTIG